jgi:vesicle coat complex subunit
MEILITKKNLKAVKKLGFKVDQITDNVYSVEVPVDVMTYLKTLKIDEDNFKEDETEVDCMFDKGEQVEVLANQDDDFNDFLGTIVGYAGEGILQVKDQDDNIFEVGENQCKKVD